ncbi:MAG: thioredoxin-dependent thiol peroxidase [Bryobacterales bacterium]|nr:thioredoxin-dependent thiol peroxidase [Bryobacterales bacterium]
MALREGDLAPDIHLETNRGEQFRLKDHRGANVVLYFYPRANTPGCTTEACEFRDALPKFAGAVVAGVSPDTVRAQDQFQAKYSLPFPLLADVEHAAAEAYGVWKEKNMCGRKSMGVERTTFLIDKNGHIAKIFNKVKPAGHAAQVLEALKAL